MNNFTTPSRGAQSHVPSACDPDLSGVDPLKLTEIRRRVAVVRSYLRIAEPDEGDRAEHASKLDLSINQFLALVRAWSLQEKASALSGSGASKGAPRPKGRRNLPVASKTAAQEVIAAADANASLIEIVDRVAERCGKLGVATPSRSTIWNMLMEARRASPGTDNHATVISRCHVKLPVQKARHLVYPDLTLAVSEANGEIIFASLGDHDLDADKLTEALKDGLLTGPFKIDSEIAASLQLPEMVDFQAMKATAARTATARILGRGIGSLDLIYHRSRSREPHELLRSKKDAPLSSEDAFHIIVEQIDAHNAARNMKKAIIPGRD
ncbi:hypothetical protein [Tsuneonella suprasediminis]|uniref:hypothetical protein n=1 Tax=Tsuneonella suprasediminis TaxID=2306996 RepID=UPI000E70A060|nr:hypothetical protein [Tsuneonella suprasediminis]